ncbi:MAG: FAD-binding oxidoreductase [Candidatus Pacearchaeota archaeon]
MVNKKELVCYETDASRLIGKFEKVIAPNSVDEIKSIIKSSNIDICPRGSGTGVVGGAVPNNSIVIDLSRLNKVTNFSLSKKIVHVEAGITLKELNEKLEPYGLEFPIDVSNGGISTIGGMIATNASGDRSMRYGTIRDWIEEIIYIDGRGDIIKTSKADITDVCGMEGITGIIVSATLRLSPIIRRSASAFQTNDLDELLSISRRLKSEKDVVILELLSPIVSRFLGLEEKYNLIIEFNSENRGKIKGKDYDELQDLRKNVNSVLFKEGYYNREDPKLFFDKIKEFIVFLDDNRIPYVGHIGANIIIAYFRDNEKNLRETTIDFIKKLKGTPGKFGIGIMRKSFIDPFQAKIIQRVKLRRDPMLKLNKGKVVDISESYIYNYKHKENFENKEHVENYGEKLTAKEVIKDMDIKNEKSNNLKEEIKFDSNKLTRDEVKNKLAEYDVTFKSELTKDKDKGSAEKGIVENVPREIVKKENINYRSIQDIMTGKYRDFSKSSSVNGQGKVTISDNLDRKSDETNVDKELIDRIMSNKNENKNGS